MKRAAGRGGSRHMWSLETGAELLVGEPNNHFELPLTAKQYLLVAGGIGITPIVGMAQMLSARGADVSMCYAARSADELVFADLLRSALGDRLQTFTDDSGARIDIADADRAAAPERAAADVRPAAHARRGARGLGAHPRPAANLRFETFGNSGAPANEAFWVKLPRHGAPLQVPADRTLLDVLNDAGIDTLFDCKRGECGLCAMDIVSAHGTIDHRDVFFSAHEKAGHQRLCACVSRVSGGGLVLDSAYRPLTERARPGSADITLTPTHSRGEPMITKRLLLKTRSGLIAAASGAAGTGRRHRSDQDRPDPADDRAEASTGRQIDAAVKLWIAQNGDKIAGRTVEVILKDDGAVPDATKRIAQELIVNDKVAVIAGFGITPTALATAPLATQSKTPLVVMAAATSSITQASPFVVRTSFTLPQVTTPIADWAAKNGIKKAVTLVADYGPRFRRRKVLRQPVPPRRRADSRQAAHAAEGTRFRAGVAEGRRSEARRAVRLSALGTGRDLHEAVRRARARQERRQADVCRCSGPV